MAYTWEEVMLGIDVRDEAKMKEKQQQDILDKQAEEAEMAGYWSLGLSLLGGAVFGPAGYFAGKQLGKYGADWGWFGGDYSDWEEMEVEEGKFHKDKAVEFNEMMEEVADDQTKAQLLNTVMDLGAMYVQAGGLQKGFEGWSDLTTFGTGDTAWTVFSDESLIGQIPGVSTLPTGQTLLTGGYQPLAKLTDLGKSFVKGGGGDKAPAATSYSVGKNIGKPTSPVGRFYKELIS